MGRQCAPSWARLPGSRPRSNSVPRIDGSISDRSTLTLLQRRGPPLRDEGVGRHGIYASNTSLSCFAIRALTTCLAGISIRAPVAGLRPMRFSRCCTTSFATPGSTNSPHRNSSFSANSLQFVEELASLRTLDAEALGEMCEQLALDHSAGISHPVSPLLFPVASGSAGPGRAPTGHSIQHLVATALLPTAGDDHYPTVRKPGRRCRDPCAADTRNGHAGRHWDDLAAGPCSCGTAHSRLPTHAATPVDLSGPRAGHWTRIPRRRRRRPA